MNVSYLFDYDIVIKVLIVGDSGCGKSCMLMKYADESFSPEHISTIGVDFKITSLERNNKKIKLQLWDSAGQERFRTITSTYYRGCHAIVLAYDVTSADSFENLPNWMSEINNNTIENTPVFLVGNKSDLVYHKMVQTADAKAFAEENKMDGFLETSAKTGAGLAELFDQIVDRVMAKVPTTNPVPPSNFIKQGVNIMHSSGAKNSCCAI